MVSPLGFLNFILVLFFFFLKPFVTTLSPISFFPSTIFGPYVLMFLKVLFEAIALKTVPSSGAAGFQIPNLFSLCILLLPPGGYPPLHIVHL